MKRLPAMTDSIHYQFSVKRINYGRNTYLRESFFARAGWMDGWMDGWIAWLIDRSTDRPNHLTYAITGFLHPPSCTMTESRFYSNLQDTPIRNLKVCVVADTWTFNISNLSQNPANGEPKFQNRVQYKPRIRGAQPTIEGPITLPNTKILSNPTGKKAYCVTVPYVKPKGWQKVNVA